MRNRAILGALGIALAAVATNLGSAEARAVVPEFPDGVRTSVGDNETRFWLTLGNLHDLDGRPVRVKIGDIRAVHRKDDVWVATTPTPAAYMHNYQYVKVKTTEGRWGAWVKFRKVTPKS